MEYSEEYIRKLIGQVVFIGFDGYEYDDKLDELINKYYAGNIILFSRNYKNPSQLLNLNKKLYENITSRCGIIPLISIDQEGGNVTRLMNDVTFPPSALSGAQSSYDNATRKIGEMIGRDMIYLGLNLNLAPPLDINPLDPYYENIRHFSTDKEVCSIKGKDFISGLRKYGVLSCAKHFPGAGDDTIDTHFEMCVQNKSYNELLEHDLYPFMNNLDVDSIMTTHTIFKEVDDYPSTLSSKVIKSILREKMNYQGIVISDALEMEAIKKYFGAVDASFLALNAGIDMILMCHDRDIQIKSFEYLYEKVLSGDLKIEDLEEKAERIKTYKNKVLPYLNKYFFNNNNYEIDLNNCRIAEEIVEKSVKIIRGTKPYIDNNTLVVCPLCYAINGAEDVFSSRNLPIILNKEFGCDYIVLENNYECKKIVLDRINNYDHILLFSYNVNVNKIEVDIINEVMKKKNCHLISMKGKMDINLYDKLDNYCVFYEYTPNSINAVVKLLKNEI